MCGRARSKRIGLSTSCSDAFKMVKTRTTVAAASSNDESRGMGGLIAASARAFGKDKQVRVPAPNVEAQGKLGGGGGMSSKIHESS